MDVTSKVILYEAFVGSFPGLVYEPDGISTAGWKSFA